MWQKANYISKVMLENAVPLHRFETFKILNYTNYYNPVKLEPKLRMCPFCNGFGYDKMILL